MKIPLILMVTLVLSACASTNTTTGVNEPAVVEPVPINYVVRQNTGNIMAEANDLQQPSLSLQFAHGKKVLKESQFRKLSQWMAANDPSLIGVRGTAGAEKFKDLGDARCLAAIEYLMENHPGVDIVVLEYNATLPAKKAMIYTFDDEMAQRLRDEASMFIVKH